MHIRRAILEALRTQLKTLGYAGVWIQRIAPTRNAWPCITLYAEEEGVQTITGEVDQYPIVPRSQTRIISVPINVWIKSTGDPEKVESDMDDASVAVEAVIVNTFGAADVLLVATDFKVVEDEPEINIVTLTYHISYYAEEQNPTI